MKAILTFNTPGDYLAGIYFVPNILETIVLIMKVKIMEEPWFPGSNDLISFISWSHASLHICNSFTAPL